MPSTSNKKPNSKRLKWPKFKNPDGSFTAEFLAYSKDMSVCYDLVALASEVLGKSMRLIAGGPRDGITRASTNAKGEVFLPKMHPNRRVVTKHELAHHFFKSNIRLRLLFVRSLLRNLEKRSGKQLTSTVRDRLTEDMCFLINILDDLRVNSLWGLLYPGSGRDMEEWYQGTIGPNMKAQAEKDFPNGDIDNLFTYAKLICIGQEAKSTKWEDVREDIEFARDSVYFASFKGCLLATRELLMKVAKKVHEQQKESDQTQPQSDPSTASMVPDATDDEVEAADGEHGDGDVVGDNQDLDELMKQRLQQQQGEDQDDIDYTDILNQIAKGRQPRSSFEDDNAGFDFRNPGAHTMRSPKDDEELRKIVQQLIEADDDEVDAMMGDAQEEGHSQAVDIQVKTSKVLAARAKARQSKGVDITKNVKAEVNLVKVKRSDIVPVILSPEEKKIAEKWKRFFMRVMGSMAMRTEEMGYELITDLDIEAELTGLPIPCYRRDVTGRGFRITILVDMSGSMWGIFPNVEKLCSVLQEALDFPFVHLKVMGFNCTERGVVNLYDFPKRAAGLKSVKSNPGGITPLSHSIQMAGRSMIGCRDENHLFVLSDGFPVYALKGGGRNGRRSYVDTNTLINWTAEATQELRRQRIKTHCFMIGRHTPEPEQMDRMFGPSNWRTISESAVYEDSFRFVTDNFLRYLRSR
jgi:hypothetical protein